MQEYIFLGIILIVLLSFAVLFFRTIFMRKVKRDVLRYRLYAVRDDFISLVATDKLDEDEFVFKEFYSLITVSIQRINEFTLREVIKVANDHRTRIEAAAYYTRLENELNKKDNSVKVAAARFFITMGEILIEKSLTLRLLTHFLFIVHILRKISEKVGIAERIPRTTRESIKAYEFYQSSQQRLGLVGIGHC